MSNVRAPQFLTDLVADLRDRHLLLPAILLVVAIFAVPLLLATGSDEEVLPPADVAATVDAGEAQPAVLAETVTVRDYRKRLDELKSRNPFESGFKPPPVPKGDSQLDDLLPPTTGSSGGGASTGGFGEPTSAGTGDSSTSTSTSTSTSSGSSSGGGSSEPEIRYFAHEIDVKVGQTGDLHAKNGVEDLTLLPNDANPVVMFLGASTDGKKAVFLVSEDVSATAGDGSCVPSGSNCDFLTMRPGDSRTFDYIPNGQTYKLVLKKIETVRIDK
jgi:hypothetical protein